MRNAGNLCDIYWFATKYHTLFTPCKGWEIGFWNCQADGTFFPNILVTFSSNIEEKMCSVYWDFDSKCWIMDFFHSFQLMKKNHKTTTEVLFPIYICTPSQVWCELFLKFHRRKKFKFGKHENYHYTFSLEKKSSSIFFILSSRKWPKYLTEHYINQFKRYLL